METVSFATARRGFDSEAVAYARKLIHKGYGWQNTARISGIEESTLRGLLGKQKQRASAVVPKPIRTLPAAPPRPVAVTACPTAEVIARVAGKYGFKPSDMASDRRTRFVSYVRHEAIWTVRQERPHLSMPSLGRIFGNRDHSTIHYAIHTHAARLAWGDILTFFATPAEQPDLFAVAA